MLYSDIMTAFHTGWDFISSSLSYIKLSTSPKLAMVGLPQWVHPEQLHNALCFSYIICTTSFYSYHGNVIWYHHDII